MIRQTRRYWEEAFNRRRLSVLDELIAEEYVNEAASPGTPPGPAGQAAVFARLWAALHDAHFEIAHIAADGDAVDIVFRHATPEGVEVVLSRACLRQESSKSAPPSRTSRSSTARSACQTNDVPTHARS